MMPEVASATAVTWQFSGRDPEAREPAGAACNCDLVLRPRRLCQRGLALNALFGWSWGGPEGSFDGCLSWR